MKAYISGSKAISPQPTFDETFPWEEVRKYEGMMPAIDPNYKDFINPLKLRRMNRIVKMGTTAAILSLQAAKIETPDAIITTTGWGCLTDTYKFLDDIIEKKEEPPSPSTFIQSTHNTVGGQIALMLECQEYNNVFVNHTSSFEYGLLDALMLIAEGKKCVLTGGVDEISEKDFELKKQAGYWKENNSKNVDLINSTTEKTLAGEGACFFLLTDTPRENSFSQVNAVFFGPEVKDILKSIYDIDYALNSIDLILSGYNGDIRLKKKYSQFENSFSETEIAYYKHLCGEYDTASSFALWLANEIIKSNSVPGYMTINRTSEIAKPINTILIHHYRNPEEHAIILVSRTAK